jgi:hypothetical protein
MSIHWKVRKVRGKRIDLSGCGKGAISDSEIELKFEVGVGCTAFIRF